MDLIKKFCSDKGRVGVAIVCLLMLCIGLISSNTGETYALSSADYTCPGNTTPEEVDGEWRCYFFATDQMMCEGMLSGYTLHSFDADNSTCIGYAKRKTYNITFNANGGVISDADNYNEPLIVKTYNSGELPIPTRFNYSFDGWYTEAGAKILTTNFVTATQTLYAHWIGNCDVTFDGNGGMVYDNDGSMSGVTSVTKSYYVIGGTTYGSTLSSMGATREGYIFKGWYTSGGDKVTSDTTIEMGMSFITLYAHWDPVTYTITYNGNGNTGGSTESSTHKYGVSKALTTNGFTKSGYTFTGWNTKADGSGTDYEDGKSVKNLTDKNNATITLYAQWTKNSSEPETPKTYIVTYNSNGGTGTMESSTYTEGVSKKLTKNTFTKTGYTFSGWNTKEDGSGTSYKDEESVTISEKSTLYAQWKANTYIVKYDANEGTGTMSSSKYTYDKELVLTKNTFTREGYIFDGWNTKEDGSGTDYKDGQSVKNLTDKNNDTITLYAQWIDEDNKENENPGDGTENENPDSGNDGDTYKDDNKENEDTNNNNKDEILAEGDGPETGSLATILVSMIGIVALVCFVFYYRKARV